VRRNVEELVKSAGQARARVAGVVRSPRDAEDLEAVAVMQLDQLGDQIGRRVAVEIGRQIGDADLRPRETRTIPGGRPNGGKIGARKGLRRVAKRRQVPRAGHQHRGFDRDAAPDQPTRGLLEFRNRLPLAPREPRGQHRSDDPDFRLDLHGLLVARETFLVPAERAQRIAAIDVGLGEIGLGGNGCFKVRDRLLVAIELRQRIAAIGMGGGVRGVERHGAIVACDRVGVATERREHEAALAPAVGHAGCGGEDAVVGLKRLVAAAELSQESGPVEARCDEIRLELQRLVERPQGCLRLAELPQHQSEMMVGRRVLRGGAHRLAQQLGGLGQAPLLAARHPEQKQGVGVARISFEHLGVARRRLGEGAALMQDHAFLQQETRGGVGHGCGADGETVERRAGRRDSGPSSVKTAAR
jgi:hypothetical protein